MNKSKKITSLMLVVSCMLLSACGGGGGGGPNIPDISEFFNRTEVHSPIMASAQVQLGVNDPDVETLANKTCDGSISEFSLICTDGINPIVFNRSQLSVGIASINDVEDYYPQLIIPNLHVVVGKWILTHAVATVQEYDSDYSVITRWRVDVSLVGEGTNQGNSLESFFIVDANDSLTNPPILLYQEYTSSIGFGNYILQGDSDNASSLISSLTDDLNDQEVNDLTTMFAMCAAVGVDSQEVPMYYSPASNFTTGELINGMYPDGDFALILPNTSYISGSGGGQTSYQISNVSLHYSVLADQMLNCELRLQGSTDELSLQDDFSLVLQAIPH